MKETNKKYPVYPEYTKLTFNNSISYFTYIELKDGKGNKYYSQVRVSGGKDPMNMFIHEIQNAIIYTKVDTAIEFYDKSLGHVFIPEKEFLRKAMMFDKVKSINNPEAVILAGRQSGKSKTLNKLIKRTYKDEPHKSKGKNDYPFEIKDELHGADLNVFSDIVKSSENFKGMNTGSIIVMGTGGAIDDKELKEYFKYKGSNNYLVDEKGDVLGNDEIETEKGRS